VRKSFLRFCAQDAFLSPYLDKKSKSKQKAREKKLMNGNKHFPSARQPEDQISHREAFRESGKEGVVVTIWRCSPEADSLVSEVTAEANAPKS